MQSKVNKKMYRNCVLFESFRSKAGHDAAGVEQMHNFSSFLTNDPLLNEMLEKAKKAAATRHQLLSTGKQGQGKKCLFKPSFMNLTGKTKCSFRKSGKDSQSRYLRALVWICQRSYTGAIDRKGLFELADGGTLFLDELQAMPLTLQTKLLRVLEDGVVRRIGDAKAIQVDVRLITALNMDPFEAVKKQILREDLFYRLHVSSFHIPPLRERKQDILLLSRHFIQTYHQQFSKNVKRLSEETKQLFMAHHWPGNVRELKHTIEYAVLMMPKEAEDITPSSSCSFYVRRSLRMKHPMPP
ncbi:sigma 54-interacting transcriptional regulator [Bacillus sp. SL00103]